MKTVYAFFLICPLLLAGCEKKEEKTADSTAPLQGQVAAESRRVNLLLDQFFLAQVGRYPSLSAKFGLRTPQDSLDDLSDSYAKQTLQLKQKQLLDLNAIDPVSVDSSTQLSLTLFRQALKEDISDFKWRFHSYPVNHMKGLHTAVVDLLSQHHTLDTIEDGRAYIKRLKAIPHYLDQLTANLTARADRGIIIPSFALPYVINDCLVIAQGGILNDFKRKLAAINLPDNVRDALYNAASRAFTVEVEPAYQKFIVYLRRLQGKTDSRSGVWKFPDGDQFYQRALQRSSSIELEPGDVHEIGLLEVARIQAEINTLKDSLGFVGELPEFYRFLRSQPQFYFPDTDQGRREYLQESRQVIESIQTQLGQLFDQTSTIPISVKQLESNRELSMGKAYYQRPALDGSIGANYYINLHSMQDMPRYHLAAQAFHEAIPGHHVQVSIAQNQASLPLFRKAGHYPAFTEGWGLYAEWLPLAYGFYQDPYANVGRLSLELWRTARLVVDTGIHSQRWTRRQAISYLVENTANSEEEAIKAVDRYIVMPAQGVAHKIGMMKIQALRREAQAHLGQHFDLKAFHGELLGKGPLPLTVLEQQMAAWVTRLKQP